MARCSWKTRDITLTTVSIGYAHYTLNILRISKQTDCMACYLFFFYYKPTKKLTGTYICLEVKACKGIQQGLYWKITWDPFIYTSALKIVPLVIRIYYIGFVKCFDITVFCSFLYQSSQFNQRMFMFKFLYWLLKFSIDILYPSIKNEF